MTTQKHFLPPSDQSSSISSALVQSSLSGLSFLSPSLTYDSQHNVIHLSSFSNENQNQKKTSKVHLISGGGSGHEPSHAAMVAPEGPLSAAVCGQVFASPASGDVEWTVEQCIKDNGGLGVLLIVKNYTGDVLHFGLSTERYQARHPESADRVRMVVVNDDVAVGKTQGGLVGRRGLAGTCLLYKVAGSGAAKGFSLNQTHFVAQNLSERLYTVGVSLSHVHVPGTETTSSPSLPSTDLEIGMGIHNEPGNKAGKIASIDKVVAEMMKFLTTSEKEDEDRGFSNFEKDGKSDEVVLLVNNLGGLSELELGSVVKEAGEWLYKNGFKVQRVFSGSYMTSLNMPGFSLTLLHLPNNPVPMPASYRNSSSTSPTSGPAGLEDDSFSTSKELILELLDAPTSAPGWKAGAKPREDWLKTRENEKGNKETTKGGEKEETKEELEGRLKGPQVENTENFLQAIKAACEGVVAAEPEITRYDTVVGDGDCGLTLKAGAEGVLEKLKAEKVSGKDAAAAAVAIAEAVEHKMGGTSGGFYSIFFNALAKGLVEAKKEKKTEKATAEVWARGLEHALNTLYKYTRARPPSRTLVDPLASFILTFASNPSDVAAAAKEAKDAADTTAFLQAKAGRAAYVEESKVKEASVPDAGAWGVWQLIDGALKGLKGQ